MTTTYREIAIEQMLLTVEEAMSRALDLWVDFPSPLKEDLEQFCVKLEAAIDSVLSVKRALDTQFPKLTT